MAGLFVGKPVAPLEGLVDGKASGEVVGKSVGVWEGLADGEASGLVVGEPAESTTRGFDGGKIEEVLVRIAKLYVCM